MKINKNQIEKINEMNDTFYHFGKYPFQPVYKCNRKNRLTD
jgi:hypothetical protein